jgi:redox-sensitive bicupin YhaK (pirin superfamily)
LNRFEILELLVFFTILTLLTDHTKGQQCSGDMRGVRKVASAVATSDGAGVKLNRVIGTRAIPAQELDPFLMLDYFHSEDSGDYIAGFPDHPHRGFETVTYMLAGKFQHKDKCGNTGLLQSGAIQWMTAGKGIIHSEMPLQEHGLISGFQLWVNLPKKDKMCNPRYQDIDPSSIPVVELEGNAGKVKVCAGEFQKTVGPVEGGYVKPQYLDVKLRPGAVFTHHIEPEKTAFAFVYSGKGTFGSNTVGKLQLAVFENEGSEIRVTAGNEEDGAPFGDGEAYACRFILVSALPLKEPVVQHGPFVMNTQEEIEQAFRDYQEGKLGRY